LDRGDLLREPRLPAELARLTAVDNKTFGHGAWSGPASGVRPVALIE
jgi:hypothetical protein